MMKTLLAIALGFSSLAAVAQTLPTREDVANQQKRIGQALKETSGPQSSPLTRLEMQSNGLSVEAIEKMSKQFPAMQASGASMKDFENLTRMNPRKVDQSHQGAKSGQAMSDLMIFVSLSMPDKMLKNYATQAKRFGGVLILRGFVGDKMSITKQQLLLLNAAGAEWDINPEPFKTFKIDKVPAIVMASADSGSVLENGCARPETYTAVFGDITVLDALDKMALRGQKKIAEMARKKILEDRNSVKMG